MRWMMFDDEVWLSAWPVDATELSERLQVEQRPDDGSRGLQPTVFGRPGLRRGATPEGGMTPQRSFKRRSATTLRVAYGHGLKPTATVNPSLREDRAKASDPSRKTVRNPFQRFNASTLQRFNATAAALVCLLFALSLRAQLAPVGFKAAKLAEMDAAITNAIVEKRLPGGVLWLERHGQVYHRAYGNRAREPKPAPMLEDTIFDLASLTKVVATAPSMMLLIERGQVKLDELALTYLPEFKGEGREAITIRQLMTHTSGMPASFTKGQSPTGYDSAIRIAGAEKLQSPPGAVFRYSDVNYILLGEIVRRVSGVTLDEFAAREIYGPLKMSETGYRPARATWERIAPTQMAGNEMLQGKVHDPKARLMGGVAGHAGVFGTAADLARYARMMLHHGELDGVRIFKPETVALMTRVQTPESVSARRGLGWDIDSGYSRPRGQLFPLGRMATLASPARPSGLTLFRKRSGFSSPTVCILTARATSFPCKPPWPLWQPKPSKASVLRTCQEHWRRDPPMKPARFPARTPPTRSHLEPPPC